MSQVSHKRPIRLRVRPDLEVVAVNEGTEHVAYVVKDPVSLSYFRLRADERFVLGLLDGTQSLISIRKEYERTFPPKRVTFAEIEALLHRFHQLGLTLSDGAGQGTILRERGEERRKQEWLGNLSNFLFIRFPGVDPEPILRVIYPLVRWCFHPLSLFASILLMVVAAFLFAQNSQQLWADLPSLDQVLSQRNVLVVMIVLSITKICHEFGHALTCKHLGRECHQIGPMLLVMTPALYCETSDSWMLPSRWQRAAVGAAGMYVEVVIASLATLIWLSTEPGLVNYVCVRIMLVCSISTVIVNANPLLRYDGYYILSDLTNAPNLAQESSSYVQEWFRKTMLGMDETPAARATQCEAYLWLYGVCSMVYRWALVLSILYFVTRFLRPHQLEKVGVLLAACAVIGMLVIPAKRTYSFFESPGSRQKIRRGRVLTSLIVGLCAVALFAFLPLPHHVKGDLEITLDGMESLYVASPGFIDDVSVTTGQRVKKGDAILRLRNDELKRKASALELLLRQHQLSVASLQQMAIRDPTLAAHLVTARSQLEEVERQHDRAVEQLSTLTITAPRDGVFVSAETRPDERSPDELPTWSGLVTDPSNHGAWLELGTQIGAISSPRPAANLVIDQSDVPFIAVDQQLTCRVEGYTNGIFRGHVTEISSRATEPQESSTRNGNAAGTPLLETYHAKALLDESAVNAGLLPRTRGVARIRADYSSLGRRLYRTLSKLLRIY